VKSKNNEQVAHSATDQTKKALNAQLLDLNQILSDAEAKAAQENARAQEARAVRDALLGALSALDKMGTTPTKKEATKRTTKSLSGKDVKHHILNFMKRGDTYRIKEITQSLSRKNKLFDYRSLYTIVWRVLSELIEEGVVGKKSRGLYALMDDAPATAPQSKTKSKKKVKAATAKTKGNWIDHVIPLLQEYDPLTVTEAFELLKDKDPAPANKNAVYKYFGRMRGKGTLVKNGKTYTVSPESASE